MKYIRTQIIALTLLFTCIALNACGGGSSDSGMLIEGTLTEAGGAVHELSLILKHGVDEKIENVEVCALGECSITDAEGQWGFVATEDFTGGDVNFTIKGHGIDTTTLVTVPLGAQEVFIDFQHVEGGHVEAHHVTVDGSTSHNEDEAHQHE